MSFPSKGWSGLPFAPASASTVGITSTIPNGSLTMPRFELGGPIEDGRNPDAAFVQRTFAAAKIAVRGWGLRAKLDAAAFFALFR